MNSGELKVDVPLATAESDCEDIILDSSQNRHLQAPNNSDNRTSSSPASSRRPGVKKSGLSPRFNLEGGGGDSVTGSLEDLVNSFDEKLTMCFQDYQEQVDKIAPVQVRSQEEIMNECQVWWTITGNFGNMMPIDWSKSTARAKQLPTLNLCAPKSQSNQSRREAAASFLLPSSSSSSSAFIRSEELVDALEEEDDMVAADLDMHSLILSSNPQEHAEPLKSADEVIKEIDDIIDAADSDEHDTVETAAAAAEEEENAGPSGVSNAMQQMSSLPKSRIVNQALRGRKLEELSSTELSQILGDIEVLVRDLSEELVNDLGVRDELEYEKELKNTFISLLLSIQSKRRACSSGGVNNINSGQMTAGLARRGGPSGNQFKYLTTVIPYQPEKGAPTLQCLQVLVKILKAINEDSPAVPALLTDYILKVLCPS